MKYILKTRTFSRLASKAGLSDSALKKAIEEMERGLVDANLGGNVYKKRIAIGSKGKSGGSRTIIATNMGDRWFFVYCFLKKNTENISDSELVDFKDLANVLLNMDEGTLLQVITDGIMEKIS